MIFIEDFEDGQDIFGVYLCKFKETHTDRAGREYYSVVLQDKTDEIKGMVWDKRNGIQHIESMDYVQIEGKVKMHQGSLQLTIESARKTDKKDIRPEDYIISAKRDMDEMYEELLKYVELVRDPHLKILVERFFLEDEDFIKKFKKHSAAKTVHHGYMGGLLEHTLGVVKLCEYYSNNYDIINKDLLITGGLFHDVGKLEELSEVPENDYTDKGKLLGHVFLGANLISDAIKKIDGFPVALANELIHCILAHQGKLEYGSPKKPALVEAIALHFADNADAKMQIVQELFDKNPDNDEWLGHQRYLETDIRRSKKRTE